MQLSMNLAIIVITSIVSFAAFNNQKLTNNLIFYPPAVTAQKQWYRFFSCGLIHADFTHLIFNMLSLYLFGGFVEAQFSTIFGDVGNWYYLVMYVSALMASLLPTYAKHKNDYYYRSLGASGAVSAVVFAGLMIRPDVEVGLFIIPPIIPGFVFAPLYLLLSAYLDRNGRDNINHSAHIWGALFGLFFIIVVGKMAGYDAIGAFIEGVKYYFRIKGWI